MSSEAAAMTPDANAMASYLRWWFSESRQGFIEIAWMEGGTSEIRHARHFQLGTEDEAAQFAANINAVPGSNVYVCASLVKVNTNRRTTDRDFSEAPGVWVDQDEEGAANLKVETFLRPNAAVITGQHPYLRQQLFFKASEPIIAPEHVRDLNIRLASLYHGDPKVINVCRVMRLPGSIAWPIKPGRIPEKTGWINYRDDRPSAYALPTLLFQAPQVQPVAPQSGAPMQPAGPARPGTRMTLAQMLEAIRTPGQWHDGMIRLVGHLVDSGQPDALIHMIAEAITMPGYSVEQTHGELQTAIDGARRRFGIPDNIHRLGADRVADAQSALSPLPASTPPGAWAPAPATAPTELYDLPEFPEADAEFGEKPEFLIDSILPRGAIAMITGVPRSGKSPVAQSMAAAMALGVPWAGRPTRKCVQVYVAAESRSQTAMNIRHYAMALMGLDRKTVYAVEGDAQPTPVETYDLSPEEYRAAREKARKAIGASILVLGKPFFLEQDVDRLIASIEAKFQPGKSWSAATAPDVIILDTLRAMSIGAVTKDEDMAFVQHAIMKIRDRWPTCTVLIIHHAPKGDPFGTSGSNRLEGLSDVTLAATFRGKGRNAEDDPVKRMEWWGPDSDGWRYGSIALSAERIKTWHVPEPIPFVLAARENHLRLLWGDDVKIAETFNTAPPIAKDGAKPEQAPAGYAAPTLSQDEIKTISQGLVTSIISLTPLQHAEIIDRLEAYRAMVPAGVIDHLLNGQTLKRLLQDMQKKGLAVTTGVGRQSRWSIP